MQILNKISVFFIALVVLGSTNAVGGELLLRKSPLEILETLRCKPQVQKQLQDWKMTGEWVKQAAGGNEWVRVDVKGSEPRLALLSALALSEVSYDPQCRPTLDLSTHPNPKVFVGRFTDKELYAELQAHKQKGMIYTWSPNMVWSIEGIKEIKSVAKKMNIPLTVVVSPQADVKAIKELVKSGKVKEADTQKHSSVELMMRGFSLHEPSLLIWKNGQLDRWARPGHEKAVLYEKWLKKASL
jgi:hypothetical protein